MRREVNICKKIRLKVLRFTNLDVLQNLEGVVEKIMQEVGETLINKSLNPLFQRGRGREEGKGGRRN